MAAQFTKREAIQEITRRLVDYFHPERIYLFGSAARGDDGPDSDLDFCVVVPDDTLKEKLRGSVVPSLLHGIGHAADIIPWRQTDFEGRAAYVRASLPATVIREGRLLYDAQRVSAR